LRVVGASRYVCGRDFTIDFAVELQHFPDSLTGGREVNGEVKMAKKGKGRVIERGGEENVIP